MKERDVYEAIIEIGKRRGTVTYDFQPIYPHAAILCTAMFAAIMVSTTLGLLLPFVFRAERPFLFASILTGLVFFLIGSAKSRWSLAPWWRSGLETFGIGAAAAALAYGVGMLLGGIT